MASFGAGLVGGLGAGYSIGSALSNALDKRGLSAAMENALVEDKTSKVEINQPDAEKYVLDSESGKYVPKTPAPDGAEPLPVIEPQYEERKERVARQFSNPAEKREAQMQAGIDYWNSKGDADKALELQDKLEQSKLRKLQTKAAERSDRQGDRDEAYELGKAELSQNFSGNRLRAENESAMAKFNEENAAYQERLKQSGGNPAVAGIPPQKPTLRVMSGMDMLNDATMLMQYDIQHGKVDPAKALQYQQMVGQVKKEVGSEAFKLLHAGDIQGAVKAFESQGDMKIPEGATVSARKGFHDVGGQKLQTNEIVVKLPNGQTQVINGLQGLEAMDAADKVINTAFKGAELGIRKAEFGLHAGNASRANERWQIEKEELKDRVDESKAQRAARKGLIDALESGDQEAISKAKQKAIASGIKLDSSDAKIAHIPVKDRRGNTEGVMVFSNGQPQQFVTPADVRKAGGDPIPFNSAADAERAQKEGKIKSGDKILVGGRLAVVN